MRLNDRELYLLRVSLWQASQEWEFHKGSRILEVQGKKDCEDADKLLAKLKKEIDRRQKRLDN